jgi:hypothetical protein
LEEKMRKHASDVRRVKVLFLAADLSKVGDVDVVPIARSLMHVPNAACPMVSSRNKGKQRKRWKLAHSL